MQLVLDDFKDRKPSRVLYGTPRDLLRDGRDDPVRWTVGDRMARGSTDCFLIGRGFSRTDETLAKIAESGACSMAINNYPRDWKPDLWLTGDPPNYFGRWIWDDPTVQKFVPFETIDMPCPREDVDAPVVKPRDCPNVHFYHATTNCDPNEFFDRPYVSWGTTADGPDDKDHPHGGVRSSMISSFRVLFHLGFKRVFLVGCDFTPHTHPDPFYYEDLAGQLKVLRTVFDSHGLEVLNTNFDSHLRVFDFLPLDEAIRCSSPKQEILS